MSEKKIFYKNMSVYLLHRSDEQDHKQGRPAILLKYKSKTSLVWWGTHLKDNKTYEKPLVLKINNIKGYFYSKGIEKVNSTDLKQAWVDFKTYKAYFLSSEEQKQLIYKFSTFTFEKNPYLQIDKQQKEIDQLIDWNADLQEENSRLKEKWNNFEKEYKINNKKIQDLMRDMIVYKSVNKEFEYQNAKQELSKLGLNIEQSKEIENFVNQIMGEKI